MQILSQDKTDVPVTVTLKAETLMQIMIIACSSDRIPTAEVVKIKDALTSTLGI